MIPSTRIATAELRGAEDLRLDPADLPGDRKHAFPRRASHEVVAFERGRAGTCAQVKEWIKRRSRSRRR